MIRGRRRRRPSPGQRSLFLSTLPRGNSDCPSSSGEVSRIIFVATPTMEPRERYQELCRLCASYDAVKMDIFGQEGKNRQLVDKIQACLPFKVRSTSTHTNHAFPSSWRASSPFMSPFRFQNNAPLLRRIMSQFLSIRSLS